MRGLDDILIGFFGFFAMDRAIRLFSNAVVEPWATKRSDGNPEVVDNWKLIVEFVLLFICVLLVVYFRDGLAAVIKP
jgi:hypothetical protein